jgi:hypothetical protein
MRRRLEWAGVVLNVETGSRVPRLTGVDGEGWRFDGTGQVTRVPWNPDAKLHNLHAHAVPALALAGHIWVYTGSISRPLSNPSHATSCCKKTFACAA